MIITMISHIRFWLKKYFFGKSNCFIFEIFQIREKWIEEVESNKSSYFPGDYPSDCVNRKLRDFSRSFFIYILTL